MERKAIRVWMYVSPFVRLLINETTKVNIRLKETWWLKYAWAHRRIVNTNATTKAPFDTFVQACSRKYALIECEEWNSIFYTVIFHLVPILFLSHNFNQHNSISVEREKGVDRPFTTSNEMPFMWWKSILTLSLTKIFYIRRETFWINISIDTFLLHIHMSLHFCFNSIFMVKIHLFLQLRFSIHSLNFHSFFSRHQLYSSMSNCNAKKNFQLIKQHFLFISPSLAVSVSMCNTIET